jgi:hypothetical protein
LAFPACSISLWRGWKIDRIANSGKSGNGRDRVEGVDSDLIDRKTDRKRLKAMKTNKTEEKAAF